MAPARACTSAAAATVALALCLAACVSAAATTRLVGTATCDAAPLATLNLTAGAHTVELTGFGAETPTLHFAVYVADLPGGAATAATTAALTLAARSYTGDRAAVAVLAACPEAGTPAAHLASDTFLALGAPLAVPLWPAGSLVVRATLLPAHARGVSPATVLAATLAVPAEPAPAPVPGSTCAVARELVPGRVLPDAAAATVLGDTAAATRVPPDCSPADAPATAQHQWYVFRVPSSSGNSSSSSGSSSEESAASVLLRATVRPFRSLWAPRIDVFAPADCVAETEEEARGGSEECPAASSVVVDESAGARTDDAVAWRAVPGAEYLLRVAGCADAGALAAGRFVLRVAGAGAGAGGADEGQQCSSARAARVVCNSTPAVLASSVGTRGSARTGGTCPGDADAAGHWYRLVYAESDARTVAAHVATEAAAAEAAGASASETVHVSVYAACADADTARGVGCVDAVHAASTDGATHSALWHVPRGTHAFLVFVRGAARNYTLTLADAPAPSAGGLVVSPLPDSALSSSAATPSSSSSLSSSSSSAPVPPVPPVASSSGARGRRGHSLDRAVTVAVLVVAVLFVGAAVGMALCWVRALRRRRRDENAAAALEMTSAFGDVLDTMDDDDDDDDFGADGGSTFTFSDARGAPTDGAVPDPLAVPQTPSTVFTIDDGDE